MSVSGAAGRMSEELCVENLHTGFVRILSLTEHKSRGVLMSVLSSEILDFLNQALLSTDFELVPLAGDASSRKYYRLINGEETYVLMVWDRFDGTEIGSFLSVQRHFAKHRVKVPRVIAQNFRFGALLLENLGDLTLERKFLEFQHQESVIPFYKQAIDEVIKIHFHCTDDNSSPCTAFQLSFDTTQLLWEMNYGKKHLLQELMGLSISDKELLKIESVFTDICTKLHNVPKYICHRDYHSRNLMVCRDEVRVIDFQDARLGPLQYDLVSLFHDSYVDLKPEMIEVLLQYYKDSTQSLRGPSSCEEFDYIFKLQMIQRCFKACGSFSSFYNLRGDRRYLKYIHKTMKKVDEVLTDFPEYSDFRNLITETGLLERRFEDL